MKYKVAAIFGAVFLILACLFVYVRGTPSYSIYLLARAVNNRDADTALKYIDVDSVTESLAKNLFIDGGAPRRTSKDLAQAISMNMPSIKEGVRTYIISAIRSGEDPGSGKRGTAIRFGNFDIHNIRASTLWNLNVATEGSTALVRLKDKPGGSARMRKTSEGYWKFVEVLIDKPGKE
jgi:hypothetical protein